MSDARIVWGWAIVGCLVLPLLAHALVVPAQSHGDASPWSSLPGGSVAPGEGWVSARSGQDGIDDALWRVEKEGLEAAFSALGLPRYAVKQTADGLRYDVFVRFLEDPGKAQVQAAANVAGGPVVYFSLAQALYVQEVSFSQVLLLRSLEGVAAVELERSVVPSVDVAAASALVVPHENLGDGAISRWNVAGHDVVVAILDTGIDKEHEVFEPERYVGGYDATVPTGRVGDELLGGLVGTWTPLNERDPQDDYCQGAALLPSQETVCGHGTHMASIVLGHDPNKTYSGMAPEAKFLDVKVFANHSTAVGLEGGVQMLPYGWGSYVLEGMEFVHRYNEGESHLGDPGRDRAQVALMAFGETEPDPDGTSVLAHAANRLVATGVNVVAAAGNCGPQGSQCAEHNGPNDTVVAPGAAERVITVGSMMHNNTVDFSDESLSGFSSRGPNGGERKPNLVAYGEPIMAAKAEPSMTREASNGYRNGTGTSQAAAQVAGIVALMIAVNRDIQPVEVKEILMGTARDTGPRGWDPGHGHGVVNALFAVGVAFGVLNMVSTIIDAQGQAAGDRFEPRDDDEDQEPPRRVNQAPVVHYDHRPSHPVTGESVVFIDRSMDPDGDDLVSFRWDFGDGNTGAGARSAHIYERPGEYRVVLTVTDVHGAAGSWDTRIMVSPGAEVEESPIMGIWGLLAGFAGVVALLRLRKKRGLPQGVTGADGFIMGYRR